jgi:hypothetical protein
MLASAYGDWPTAQLVLNALLGNAVTVVQSDMLDQLAQYALRCLLLFVCLLNKPSFPSHVKGCIKADDANFGQVEQTD